MNYKDLEENKHYLIDTANKYANNRNLEHISIIYKGNKACLIETHYPNRTETHKEWVVYFSSNFNEIIEELTRYNRAVKLNELLKDEKL